MIYVKYLHLEGIVLLQFPNQEFDALTPRAIAGRKEHRPHGLVFLELSRWRALCGSVDQENDRHEHENDAPSTGRRWGRNHASKSLIFGGIG
jgi:hypothetical protein